MNFKKWVKSIQTAGYNGARTVIQKHFGPNYFFSSALKVTLSDFIQNMSQDPSKCLKQRKKVNKLDYIKNAS